MLVYNPQQSELLGWVEIFFNSGSSCFSQLATIECMVRSVHVVQRVVAIAGALFSHQPIVLPHYHHRKSDHADRNCLIWADAEVNTILEENPLLILIILKTFECLWLHTLHAKPRENEFESFSGQCLSEYIRQLILCPHEIQLNHSLFHLFSNEMMSDVDVFRPGVLDVIAAESYGTLVVITQRDVIVCKAIIR
ncbi:hypothetical protein Tco_0524700 [Tanacetum coccineum]